MAALAQCPRTGHLAPPPDRAARERVEQQVPQLAALHLGTLAGAVVGSVEQDGPVRVEDPVGLAAFEDECAEPLGQARRLQRRLAGPGVDVEHPALAARGG